MEIAHRSVYVDRIGGLVFTGGEMRRDLQVTIPSTDGKVLGRRKDLKETNSS